MATDIKKRNNFIYHNSTTINYFRFFMTFCADKVQMAPTRFVQNLNGPDLKTYIKPKPSRYYKPDGKLEELFINLYSTYTLDVRDETFVDDFVSAINHISAMPDNWINEKINSGNFDVFLLELFKIGSNPDIIPQNNLDNYIQQKIHPMTNIDNVEYGIDNINELLNKYKCIYLIGEGGLGKTTFLKNVEAYQKNTINYSKIIYIQLKDLLNDKNFHSGKKCGPLSNYINELYSINPQTLCLILLDGLDELLSVIGENTYNELLEELPKIPTWQNMHTIISSRYIPSELNKCNKAYTLNYVPQTEIETLLKKYKTRKISIPEPIQRLLKIPMYYEMFKNANTNELPQNRYDLFITTFKKLYNQRHKKDISQYHFIYFYILPKIALYTYNQKNLSRHEIGSKIKLKKILTTIINKSCIKEIEYEHICNEIAIRPSSTEIDLTKDDIIKLLIADGLLTYKNIKYCFGDIFNHEFWRAFLVAFSLHTSIKCLQENYNDIDYAQEYSISLNVPKDAAIMICEKFFPAYLIQADSEHEKSEKKAALEKQFKTFFDNLSASPNNDEEVCGYIKYAHLAFQLAVDFQFERIISETPKSTYYEIVKKGYEANDITNDNSDEYDYYHKEFIEITTKMAELSRKSENYEDAIDYIKRGSSIANEKGDEYEIASFAHQQAKVTIAKLQGEYISSYEKLVNSSDFKKAFCEIVDTSDFKEAIMCIKKHSKNFTMSANLYGRMLSTPALYIKNADLLKTDPVEAFLCYYNHKAKMPYRYVTYTIRQGISLLLRGIIRVKDDYQYEKDCKIGRDALEKANCDAYKINSNTLSLATDMYKKISDISDRSVDFLDYLIGTKYHIEYINEHNAEIAKRKKEKAISFFNRADHNSNPRILSVIRRKQLENKKYNEQLNSFLTSHKKEINTAKDQADKLHPIYLYIDVKNLVLSYEHFVGNEKQLTDYSELFQTYEQELNPLCNAITNEMSVKFDN